METKIKTLPPALRHLAEKHFVLLESHNRKKQPDTLQLNLSGYSDVMYLITDIVKVCMIALEYESDFARIPEPATNISGVLGIILDLVPYEEADLLDAIREMVLHPADAADEDEGFVLENLFLSMPSGLC